MSDLVTDIRTMTVVRGRSINLALSVRGREALRQVGLEEEVTREGIKMHARMIHGSDGSLSEILYGRRDQVQNECIVICVRRNFIYFRVYFTVMEFLIKRIKLMNYEGVLIVLIFYAKAEAKH